jgi:hypothetical protein
MSCDPYASSLTVRAGQSSRQRLCISTPECTEYFRSAISIRALQARQAAPEAARAADQHGSAKHAVRSSIEPVTQTVVMVTKRDNTVTRRQWSWSGR